MKNKKIILGVTGVFVLVLLYVFLILEYQKNQEILPSHLQKIEEIKQKNQEDTSFTVYDLNLKKLSLSSLKGRVVLLNFWATWCAPCIEELPSLNALAGSFSKQLTVLLVSNEYTDVIKNFLMAFPNFHPNTIPANIGKKEMLKSFNVRAFPETYIFNKQGKLYQKITGPQQWDSKVWKNKISLLISEK